ncbi:MAG TPA: 3'-5' exonuclease [Bacteroidales bacterium]|nr:3'-5' exonuclease [Bacteroidales bacterium]HPR57784.1 3'-5' exonuclease [Bacteroidales bacterium]HRW95977.1 3'-5' exonuclease [Bacteroidales bacterium]
MELNLTKPLAVFDLETTGVNVAVDRIVEISIVKIFPGGKTEVFTRLINPTIPIPARAIEIHGITDEAVKDAPTFKEVARELSIFFGNSDLAGYNSNKFDIPLLVEEFLRADVDFDLKGRKFVDVQNIFHKMEPRTLHAAYRFYCNKELDNNHSAEADAQATYEILKAQLDRYHGVQVKNKDGGLFTPVVNDMGALSNFSEQISSADLVGHIIFNEKHTEVFNFGKYKGKSVEDIFIKEPAYYDWMMKADFPLSTKKVITAIKLRQFNKGSVTT